MLNWRDGVVCETVNGFRFILVDIEDGQQLCAGHQVAESFGQMNQLNLPAVLNDGNGCGNKFTKTIGVDVGNTFKIQKDLGLSLCQQRLNRARQRHTTAAKSEADSHFIGRVQN